MSGEPDKPEEGPNSIELNKPGAFGVILNKSGRKDDKQEEDVNTEDDNPNFVVAAEIAPDAAELEVRLDEYLKREASYIKEQLKEEVLQDATSGEVVEERKEQHPSSRRRCVWILLLLW
jgi:hypothetical protein